MTPALAGGGKFGHGAAAMTEPADKKPATTSANAAPPEETRSELSSSLSVAVPLALTNLGNIAMNTTDVVMIGWLGAEALAAGVLGFTMLFLFLLMGLGMTSAVSPLTAQAYGAGDIAGVRRTIRQGFWAVVLFCIPAIAILMNGETILLWLGQDPLASRRAGVYLTIAAWSLPFILWFTVLRALLATIDRTAIVFGITCLGIVMNGLLNYGLIFGNWGMPRLEIAGAAVALVATSATGFVLLALYVALHPATRGYRVFMRLWRSDIERLKAIGRLALPISLTMLLEEGLFATATIMVGWLGPVALAGHTIALQCASVAFSIPLGIGQAGTVRVGIAAGRRDSRAVGHAGWTAIGLGLGFMILSALTFWIFPEPLARLFLDSSDPDAGAVLSIAVALLAVAAVFQIFDGVQVVGLGILRGLNDTRVPLGFAIFGYWICGAPLAYVLGFVAGYGAVGVWSGFILGLGVMAGLILMRFGGRDRYGLVAKFIPAES